jgi:hypothetical protein
MDRPTDSTFPLRTATAVPVGQPGSMVTTCLAVKTVMGGPGAGPWAAAAEQDAATPSTEAIAKPRKRLESMAGG